MKKYFVLTSVLVLSACGGGSGGGAGTSGAITTPNEIITPDNISRTLYTVDSDSGLSMMDINATRIANVSYAIRIAQSIENDNSGIDYSATVRNASKRRNASNLNLANVSPQDISNAYDIMHDIFVNHNYTNYTNHDVLVALALIYLDKTKVLELLGHENNRLDEKIANLINGLSDNDNFAKDAKDMYQDFGRDFELTLDDAKFYTNSNDTNWYKFVFDENGKITHLQGQDGYAYEKDKNGVFTNDIVGKRYSFEHNGTANNHSQHVEVELEYSTADVPSNVSNIRADLIQQIAQKYGWNAQTLELNDVASWINNAPIIEVGAECTNANGCIELGNADYREEVRIETAGKNLGLKYSDFGLLHEKADFHEGDSYYAMADTYTEHNGFIGGYEDKQATPESGMVFKGNSYVGLTRKLSDEQIEEVGYQQTKNNYYTGTATLTVGGTNNNLTQNLVADFSEDGWYEVTVDNLPVGQWNPNNGNVSFTFDDKGNQIAEEWQVRPDTHSGEMENLNIKYYGPEPGNATEAVGFVQYIEDHESDSDWTFKADITFGGKRD